MFSDSGRDFMARNMKIVVESIESKLNEPIFAEFKAVAVTAIESYINVIKDLEGSGGRQDLTCSQDNKAEESIRTHFCEITDGMDHHSPIYQALDALRHSFSCYAYDGLHQLYTRQENESWYPKIKLTEILEPNDIDLFPQNLTIYRGCDISEFENNSFGQAWSTSPRVAKEFAHVHYSNQEWFDENKRVVLEASCSREDVLFSDQSIEYEVVVDVAKLHDVRKHALIDK